MFSGLPTPIHVLPQDSEPVAVMLAPSPVSSLLPTPQADAPNPSLIPESDAVGVTVLLLTCTYRRQEFIRVGYYVNNEYPSLELRESPPAKPDFSQVGAACLDFRLGVGAVPSPTAPHTQTPWERDPLSLAAEVTAVRLVPAVLDCVRWLRQAPGGVSRPAG